MNFKIFYFLIFTIGLFSLISPHVHAQNLVEGEKIFHGKIIEVVDERELYIPKSEVVTKVRFLKTQITIEGEEREVIVKHSGQPFRNKHILVGRVVDKDGQELFLFRSVNRTGLYVVLLLLFIATCFLVIGKKAVRPLLSLFAGILILVFFMVPYLIETKHLVLFGVLIAFALLFITLVITHGFRKDTYIAFGGIILGLIVTLLLTYGSVTLGNINGFSLETSVLLGYVENVRTNFQHVLLLSIMIGMFGILDDIAVTQVSIVRELKRHSSHMDKKKIFMSAMSVGRDHASALVNTLFFAYGGVVLPAIMFVHAMQYPLALAVSQEIFAVEIVRAIAGSIGFLLIIPITTLLATLYSHPKDSNSPHVHHH